MANIKTTPGEWDVAREYFEAGLSLSEIEKKTGISKPSLSKRSNKEGWLKGGEKQQLIAQAVDVLVAKETLNATALQIHDEIVTERTKHIVFFQNAAVRNVAEAMSTKCETQGDFRQRAETILKGREAALGKEPSVQTNIQNNIQQNNKISMSDDDLMRIATGGS